MKKICNISGLTLISLILTSCVTSNVPYAYDDIYYSPSNDPIQQARQNPTQDFNRSNDVQYERGYENRYTNNEDAAEDRQGVYQNRYTEQEQLENNQAAPVAPLGNEGEDQYSEEYYDEDYAETLQRINSPVRSFDTYDPYQRDRIIYTQNPVFVTPNVYNGFQFWDPFVPATGLSVGWNSFNGWNVGVSAGFGVGFGCRPLNPYIGLYDPFWNPGFGFNNWGWRNNWGWDPFWGWGGNVFHPYNRFGFNYGFNRGIYNRYNNGRFDNYYGGSTFGGGRRQITAPRGSNGSRNVYTGSGNGSNRPTRTGKSGVSKTVGDPSGRPAQNGSNRPTRATNSTPAKTVGKPGSTRPTRSNNQTTTRPSVNPSPTEKVVRPNSTTTRRPARSTTPERYKTPSNPSNYSRPRGESTPSRATTPSRTTTRPKTPTRQQTRPSYTPQRQNNATPKQNNNYSRPNRNVTRPQQPARQSRPSYNNSRSRPSYNRSTPSYSAPRSSGGGSSRGSSSRPSRR